MGKEKQKFNFRNILNQAIRPQRGLVMFKKILTRLSLKKGSLNYAENLKWLNENYSEISDFASANSSNLWKESLLESEKIKKNSEEILKYIDCDLGGGGAYPLLYFLTRLIKPKNILETGVAAGFSSYAMLLALRKNQFGTLYSSDFPYFRIENPEKYIGIVIEESLKQTWKLFIEGDEKNISNILREVNEIDLFCYDSDKSYKARENIMKYIKKYLSKDAIIIMDDIQDNSFFYDFIKKNELIYWKVFKFEDKFLGLVGNSNLLF